MNCPAQFLELFGKPARESACECERSNTMMLGPVLAMVNGPIVADAIADPAGSLSKFTAATPDDAAVVEQIYLSVLNRHPTADEVTTGVTAIRSAKPDFVRLTAEHDRRAKALTDYEATVPAKQTAWEAALLADKPTAWIVLELAEAKATSRRRPSTRKTMAALSSAARKPAKTCTRCGPKPHLPASPRCGLKR